MKAHYYRCTIEEYGDVIIGFLSHSSYQACRVIPGRDDQDAVILKLYRVDKSTDEEPMMPLIRMSPEEVLQSQRLSEHGHLIEVGYPWGSQFVDQLEWVVNDLGLETYQDPFKEGSDSFGIVVGQSDDVSVIAPLLDERAEYCNDHPDDEDAIWSMEEPIFNACQERSVIWLDTDWKHFEVDLDDFSVLGMTAERVEPVILSKPDELNVENIMLFGEDQYLTFSVHFSHLE